MIGLYSESAGVPRVDHFLDRGVACSGASASWLWRDRLVAA